MSRPKNNREQLVIRLIEDDIDTIGQGINEGDSTYLADMLRDGFYGYKNQTLQSLKTEAMERGLIPKKRIPAGDILK